MLLSGLFQWNLPDNPNAFEWFISVEFTCILYTELFIFDGLLTFNRCPLVHSTLLFLMPFSKHFGHISGSSLILGLLHQDGA